MFMKALYRLKIFSKAHFIKFSRLHENIKIQLDQIMVSEGSLLTNILFKKYIY